MRHPNSLLENGGRGREEISSAFSVRFRLVFGGDRSRDVEVFFNANDPCDTFFSFVFSCSFLSFHVS